MNITKQKLIEKLEYLCTEFDIEVEEAITELDGVDELDRSISINISFPSECGNLYTIDKFINYIKDIENIVSINSSTVRTKNVRQTILDVNEFDFDRLNLSKYILKNNNYSIQIIDYPFLIGVIASKNGKYDNNFGITPCSLYYAIEIVYFNDFKLSIEEEELLLDSFRYHVTNATEIPIKYGEFLELPDYLYDDDENLNETGINDFAIKQEELLKPTLAMEYYINALTVDDNNISYLMLYKIIEFFAPLVSRKRSYDLLNLKLDVLSIKERDHKYLDSIFKLTKDYEVSLRDNELANTVMSECIDIIELYQFLPNCLKTSLSKDFHFKMDEYDSLSKEKIAGIKKSIADCLYNTRNNIVHAKSNYNKKGNELLGSDLDELNQFMKKLTSCLILWNSRQPKGFQL